MNGDYFGTRHCLLWSVCAWIPKWTSLIVFCVDLIFYWLPTWHYWNMVVCGKLFLVAVHSIILHLQNTFSDNTSMAVVVCNTNSSNNWGFSFFVANFTRDGTSSLLTWLLKLLLINVSPLSAVVAPSFFLLLRDNPSFQHWPIRASSFSPAAIFWCSYLLLAACDAISLISDNGEFFRLRASFSFLTNWWLQLNFSTRMALSNHCSTFDCGELHLDLLPPAMTTRTAP